MKMKWFIIIFLTLVSSPVLNLFLLLGSVFSIVCAPLPTTLLSLSWGLINLWRNGALDKRGFWEFPEATFGFFSWPLYCELLFLRLVFYILIFIRVSVDSCLCTPLSALQHLFDIAHKLFEKRSFPKIQPQPLSVAGTLSGWFGVAAHSTSSEFSFCSHILTSIFFATPSRTSCICWPASCSYWQQVQFCIFQGFQKWLTEQYCDFFYSKCRKLNVFVELALEALEWCG